MVLTPCRKETLVTYRVEGRNPGIALLAGLGQRHV